MIPRWLATKRQETCTKCLFVKSCQAKITLLSPEPECPIGALHSLGDEVRWRQAWPELAAPASGCCDSALNY